MSILSQLGTKIGTKIKELTNLIDTKLDKTAKAIDSDKFDGLDSTQFVRTDASTTMENSRFMVKNPAGSSITHNTAHNGLEVFQSSSEADATMAFHIGGDFAVHFGLDGGTNKLSVGGWSLGPNSYAIYHENNKPTPSEIGAYTAEQVDTLVSSINVNSTSNIDWIITGTGLISSDNGHTLRRQVHNNQWDTQAYLSEPATKLSFMIAEGDAENNHAMIGLNTDPTTDAYYGSIDYCWYIDNGQMLVYESGISKGAVGTWSENSIYSIEYDGANILYKQDDITKRTVSVANGITFYVDSSFHSDIILSNIIIGNSPISTGTFAFEAISNTASGAGGTGIISFNTIRHNSGGAFNGSRFTAPIKGFYQFNATVLSNSASITRLDLLVNGSVVYRTESTQAASGYQNAQSIQAVYLQSGDYVEFSSGTHATYGTVYNYCSGYLIK